MKVAHLVLAGTALLVTAGCSAGTDATGPAQSRSMEARPTREAGARRVPASGTFAAMVDFSTLTLTPRGRNCRLVVSGQLVFSGTIEGVATGQTTALVFAPCADVATTPPGTYRDVFRSELVFEGTVDGEPASAKLLYAGRVQQGGEIEGRLLFSHGVRGRLRADAMVAVGGEYHGTVVVR